MSADRFDHLGRIVGHREQVEVAIGDGAVREQGRAHPIEESGPVRAADEDHREVPDLARLDERQRLEQLVERPESAGQDDEPVRVLDEHHLAREEVAELDAEIHVRVQALLVGQLDVAADGQAAAFTAAAVGGLHRARATAGDDRVAGIGQTAADLAGGLVDRIVRSGSGRSRRPSPPGRPGPSRRSLRRTRRGCAAPATDPCRGMPSPAARGASRPRSSRCRLRASGRPWASPTSGPPVADPAPSRRASPFRASNRPRG